MAKTKRGERKEAWMRVIVFIVSGIIMYAWWYLTILLAIVNLAITAAVGKREKELAEFSEYFNTQAYNFFKYVTFVSNARPFPFSSLKRISKFK